MLAPRPSVTQEISRRAGALYDKLRVLVEEMETLGKQLGTAHKTYDSLYGNTQKIALDQSDARAFHRDVGAGAHGNPDVRLRQRRRIVDAVPGHRHDRAAGLKLADDAMLVLGRHVRVDAVDTELPGDRLGRH